jgi:hypothetical protein
MKNIFFILFILFVANIAKAQTGIGTTTPDASAKLEISSPNKGFLPPRVSLTATNSPSPITSPANGLMVFNTVTAGISPNQVVPGYYYWDATGLQWVSLSTTVGNVQNQAIYRSTSNTNANSAVSTWNSRFNNIAAGDLTFTSSTSFALSNGIYKLEWALPYQQASTYNLMVLQEYSSSAWGTFLNNNGYAAVGNGGDNNWGGGTFAADIVDCSSSTRTFRLFNLDGSRGLYYGATFIITKLNPSVTTSTTADNLGNHIATKNISLNDYYLSNDGGDEGIRIDNTGKIGIGTTSPSSTLTVGNTDGTIGGEILLNPTSNQFEGGQIVFKRSRTGSTVDWTVDQYGTTSSNARFRIFNGNSEMNGISILENGNIGMGTANPTAKLNIDGGGIKIFSGFGNTTNRPGLNTSTIGNYEIRGVGAGGGVTQGDGADDGFLRLSAGGGTNSNQQASIDLSGYSNVADMGSNIVMRTAGAERFRINADGKIGLGTSSPSTAIHIQNGNTTGSTDPSTNSLPSIYLYNTNSTSTSANSILAIRTNGSGGGNPYLSFDINGIRGYSMGIDNGDSDKFKLIPNWNFSSLNSPIITFDTDNRVGIGTASPLTRLHLQSSASTTFYVESTTADNNGMVIFNANTDQNWGPNYHEFLMFQKQGNTIGQVVAASNGSGVTYNTSSDYRLKKDLRNFSGLDLVNKIKTYDFAWKTNSSRMYGVMAHELQEILPYAVVGTKDSVDASGKIIPQGVDYGLLTPILIKAIQEQENKIKQLTMYNEALEKSLQLIQRRLLKLEKKK